jgi:ADP-ribose pyrophosphatase YjhB (NUDIX family)
MRVRVRGLIWHDGRMVVRRETRMGRPRTALPGGRVKDGETLEEALTREVAEETGIEAHAARLIYVAEIVSSVQAHHLELVFLAEPVEAIDPSRLELMTVREAMAAPLLPPLAAEIERDQRREWADTPRWLGNLWDPQLAYLDTPA